MEKEEVKKKNKYDVTCVIVLATNTKSSDEEELIDGVKLRTKYNEVHGRKTFFIYPVCDNEKLTNKEKKRGFFNWTTEKYKKRAIDLTYGALKDFFKNQKEDCKSLKIEFLGNTNDSGVGYLSEEALFEVISDFLKNKIIKKGGKIMFKFTACDSLYFLKEKPEFFEKIIKDYADLYDISFKFTPNSITTTKEIDVNPNQKETSICLYDPFVQKYIQEKINKNLKYEDEIENSIKNGEIKELIVPYKTIKIDKAGIVEKTELRDVITNKRISEKVKINHSLEKFKENYKI